MKDKMQDFIKKMKERFPIYMEKAKEIAQKVATVIKEKAPIYMEKLNKIAKKVFKEIKEKSPIYINKAKEFYKKNPKQVMVGGVILLVAIILLIVSIPGEKKKEITHVSVPTLPVEIKNITKPVVDKDAEKNEEAEVVDAEVEDENAIYFNFTTVAKKDFNYQVFYTVKNEIWYDPSHVVSVEGKAGENTYKVKIPATKVYRIRLDFDVKNEEITVSNVYLSGGQEVDLNNFKDYLYNDIEEKTINADGSLTVLTKVQDPHIGYYIKQ